jgi:outer membrane biosynthesis protein TonB
MRPSRRVYIAWCQRLLVLGVVVVALVPAAAVVSLDVVGVAPTRPEQPDQPEQPLEVSIDTPAQGRLAEDAEQMRQYAVETTHESEVPVAPVDPVVHEVALTPKKSAPKVTTPETAEPAEAPEAPEAKARRPKAPNGSRAEGPKTTPQARGRSREPRGRSRVPPRR